MKITSEQWEAERKSLEAHLVDTATELMTHLGYVAFELQLRSDGRLLVGVKRKADDAQHCNVDNLALITAPAGRR